MFDFDLREILLRLPAILFALSIHEFFHAYTAVKLGDSTPEKQGRLTLNPIHHLDPIGFILFIFAGFGWAKPVQINPFAFKHPKRDDILVSVAGPLSNFISAIFFAIIVKLLLVFYREIFSIEGYGDLISEMLKNFIGLNLSLAFFNLIPIPPLDGSHILFAVLPDRYQRFKDFFFRFGSILLILIIFIESNTNTDILFIGRLANMIYKGLFYVLRIY